MASSPSALGDGRGPAPPHPTAATSEPATSRAIREPRPTPGLGRWGRRVRGRHRTVGLGGAERSPPALERQVHDDVGERADDEAETDAGDDVERVVGPDVDPSDTGRDDENPRHHSPPAAADRGWRSPPARPRARRGPRGSSGPGTGTSPRSTAPGTVVPGRTRTTRPLMTGSRSDERDDERGDAEPPPPKDQRHGRHHHAGEQIAQLLQWPHDRVQPAGKVVEGPKHEPLRRAHRPRVRDEPADDQCDQTAEREQQVTTKVRRRYQRSTLLGCGRRGHVDATVSVEPDG